MAAPKIDIEKLEREFAECMAGEDINGDAEAAFRILAEKGGSVQLIIYFIREITRKTMIEIRRLQKVGNLVEAEDLRTRTINADISVDLEDVEIAHPELLELIIDIRYSLTEMKKPVKFN